MRTYDAIKIDRAVVHLVSPRTGALTPSAAELTLDDDVRSFLTGHVQKGLGDAQATAARFNVTEAGSAASTCSKLIASGARFVDNTAALAKLLYDASVEDARVSDGTLVVLRCTGDTTPFVAMLKLDPSAGYRPVVTRKGRQSTIQLKVQQDMLPSVRERIQKAAFVRTTTGNDFHMLVVDRQRGGDSISQFFLRDFLGAVHSSDNASRTKALYQALTRAERDVSDELEPVDRSRLKQFVNGSIVGGHINVDDLLDNLPIDDEYRPVFESAIAEAMPDREFDIDRTVAEQLVKRTRYLGDNGLTVSVRSENWTDMVTETGPDDDGVRTITIRTKAWERQ